MLQHNGWNLDAANIDIDIDIDIEYGQHVAHADSCTEARLLVQGRDRVRINNP